MNNSRKHSHSNFEKPATSTTRKFLNALTQVSKQLGLGFENQPAPQIAWHAVEHFVEQGLTLKNFVELFHSPVPPKQVKQGRLSFYCPQSDIIAIWCPANNKIHTMFKLESWKVQKFYSNWK